MTGDGTTSTVLLIGEFLKQAELYIADNLHPRVITEGFEAGKKKALAILDEMKITLTEEEKRDVLVKIAKTSLNTKLHPKMASQLTDICVDAMLSIDQAGIKRLDFIRIQGPCGGTIPIQTIYSSPETYL